MSLLPWKQRFFSSTRGRIVALLRRTSRTVDELAQALDLTDNAVRAHLARAIGMPLAIGTHGSGVCDAYNRQ